MKTLNLDSRIANEQSYRVCKGLYFFFGVTQCFCIFIGTSFGNISALYKYCSLFTLIYYF